MRSARHHHIPIVLLHENDPGKGGVEFSTFFQNSPQDLIMEGLYDTIAVAPRVETAVPWAWSAP